MNIIMIDLGRKGSSICIIYRSEGSNQHTLALAFFFPLGSLCSENGFRDGIMKKGMAFVILKVSTHNASIRLANGITKK